ncbi:MAG: CHAT domain-containing protein [Chloroflexota bacterium]
MANASYLLVEDSQTGQQALEQAGNAQYIVIHFGDGCYAVIKPGDLKRKLSMWKKLGVPLREVPANVFAPHLTDTCAEDAPDVHERVKALKANQPLVILSTAGDFLALEIGGVVFRGGTPKMEASGEKGLHKLGVEESAGETIEANAPQKRYINVELKDSSEKNFDPAAKPLQNGEVYTLSFDVDLELRATAIATKGAAFAYPFQEGEQLVKITVRLESEDFDFFGEQEKTLLVPRTGKSRNKAAFLMEPRHEGECQINAIFLKDGNFVQVMALRFYVGALFQATTLGRDVEAAFGVQPRDVSLTILNTGSAFQLVLIAPGVAATAILPLKLPELKDITNQVREKLQALVDYEEDKHRFYQQAIDIPCEIHAFALQQLAEAGFRLYQRIFFGPSADEQSKNLGRKLRQLAQKDRLKIQIFSQDFVLPWGLLYMADRFDPDDIRPEFFLGLKHIIEHIPLQQSLSVTDNRMDGSRGLAVGLNVNGDIDKDMGAPLIGSQLNYWQTLQANGARVSLVTRQTADEVTRALANPDTPDQVLYFYCHGISQDVDESGGVSKSRLVLSGHGSLTLDDLNLFAPPDDQLRSAPLVFINACESAQLSPLVYDGFVPYFMSKGARGVIGTEVETPALFAVHWAERFFDRFLRGETLGEIFLALRKEFLEQHHNVMGLLYALYVDGDTRLEPAVKT